MSTLISTTTAAEVLGVTPGRVRQLVADGRLRPAHREPRLLLFRRADVTRLAARPRPAGRPSRPVRKAR